MLLRRSVQTSMNRQASLHLVASSSTGSMRWVSAACTDTALQHGHARSTDERKWSCLALLYGLCD